MRRGCAATIHGRRSRHRSATPMTCIRYSSPRVLACCSPRPALATVFDMAEHWAAKADGIPPCSLTRVVVDDEAVCLVRLADGSFHALADCCTHEEFSLSEGELIGSEVECPQHSSRFDV